MQCIILILCFTLTVSATDNEWRGWRGLENQAISDSSGPEVWSSTDNILWKTHIDGEGFSSPVVSNNDVFITSAHGESSSFKTNSGIVLLITSLIIFLILRNQYLLLRNIVINRFPKNANLVYRLLLLIIYGFLIFGFCSSCWMYFSESRNEGERVLISYMFSGALIFLCILLTASESDEDSIYRIITGILVIILVVSLIIFRPMPEFFLVADFFKVRNIWLFQLTLPAVILPVIFSLYLIIKTLNRILNPRNFQQCSDQNNIEKLSFLSPSSVSHAAVIAGYSGFMAIPLIVACKWFLRTDLARIQDALNLKLFFNPAYAYPFFLGMLSFGFLLWLFIEKHNDRSDTVEKSGLFPVLIITSVILFILLNYSRNDSYFRREIICVDRRTGIIKWKRDVLIGPASDCSNYNSQATPTPLIDSNSVYAYFGSAGLVSADKSGNIVWKNASLPFTSIHGAAASPVFWKGGIIILSSMSVNPYLTSVDKRTGKEQWITYLPLISGVGGEYRTPLVIQFEGQELIIEWSTARSQIVVYEAKTGKTICEYNTDWAERGEAIATPCIHEGKLYLSDSKSAVALDVLKLLHNDSPVVWRTELAGRGPATSSPLHNNGMLFMISDNGFATCLDSKTGNILWQEKLKGVYFSSPVSIGSRIYFSNTAGMTSVIESSGKYTMITENLLPEGIYSSLAPVDGELFIRTKNTLWCVK